MNDINLIDSYQAHLPVQYASNIKFIRQMWHDSELHPSRTSKTSHLFAPLAVRVHTGCSTFLMKYHTLFLLKTSSGKMSQNLSSAEDVIGT